MTPDQSFTLIVTSVGIGGALFGILLGHFLTRSSQHRQWLRDNRKEEFKEIVNAMSYHIVEHLSFTAAEGTVLPQSKQSYVDSLKAASVIFVDRIYIHDDLEKAKIPDRFIAVMTEYGQSEEDKEVSGEKVSTLLKEVKKMALKD